MMDNRYFARNPNEYSLLKDKHITFVGLGSFGSAIALMAVRAGLQNFTLIDPDVLAPENMGRHMACSHFIGKPKVEAVGKEILCINPDVKIGAWRRKFDASLLPRNTDLVVCCTDSYSADSLVNSVVLERKVPAVFSCAWPMAKVGEIYYVIPGKTPCYDCYAIFRKGYEHVADKRGYTDKDFDHTRTEPQEGLWANILAICGITFQMMLGLLRGKGSRYRQNLYLFNINDFHCGLQPLAVTLGKVKKGCIVCDESLLLSNAVQ